MSSEERERFEALFRQHYPAVVRYVVRRLGPGAAQDVVSETFLVAWRRLDQVPGQALPWLYATARRLVANEIRKQQREQALTARLTARLGGRTGGRSGGTAAGLDDVVAERLAVTAALDGLSERDREVLRLVEWEGLDDAAAAVVMDCSRAAFRVRLHRARRRLAKSVAELAELSELSDPEPPAAVAVPRGPAPAAASLPSLTTPLSLREGHSS